ncbi:MAG TPA: hypothetical protein VE401_04910 [Solirubrobacterales bacterium]|jgi:hypothetical protein|nr:hypothetical protein [Solirubrobacterales bacterium]
MDPGLLIAQAEHGPGMHGGVLPLILVAIALVGGVVVLVLRARKEARKGSERDPESDRGPEA